MIRRFSFAGAVGRPAAVPMTDDGGVSHRSTAQSRPSLDESFAGADSVADAERARALRRMKLVALSFLLGATVIFLVCTWAQSRGPPSGWATFAQPPKRAWWVRSPTG